VGIDPNYAVTAELAGPVSLFRTSSDEFFTRPEPLWATGGLRFDLSFIDGMHLFEFALRDFINAERHSTARGLIVFDDVLPRNVDEAARARHTGAWTGDVFLVLAVLAEFRPDLYVVPLNTTPTGLLAVFGLDPASPVLTEHYGQIVARFRRADPQQVPADLLDRTTLVPPRRFLDCGVLETLAGLGPDLAPAAVGANLRPLVSEVLGVGFGGLVGTQR
jgi:hypothetical protein